MEKEEVLELLKEVEAMSSATKVKVGCVITKAGIPVSYGYNQAPKGFDIEDDKGETIKENSIHAEVMCISTSGIRDYTDCELWVSIPMCRDCAKLVAALGFKAIYYTNDYNGSTIYDMKENKFRLNISKV